MRSINLLSQLGSKYKAFAFILVVPLSMLGAFLSVMADRPQPELAFLNSHEAELPISNVEIAVISDCNGCQVSITPPEDSGRGQPGDKVSYPYSITNYGSQPGIVTIITNSLQNWKVAIDPSTSYPLLRGHTQEITVSVMVPTDAISGALDVTTVTATLQCDTGQTSSDTAIVTTGANCLTQTYLFLPVIYKGYCPDESLLNGEFECFRNGLPIGWTKEEIGGFPVTVVCQPENPFQGCAARIGDPNFPPESPNSVPMGRGTIYQAIRVPDVPSPTLTFDYKFCSFDEKKYDTLEVAVTDVNVSLWKIGNTTGTYPKCYDTINKQPQVVDLRDYRGKCVTLYFSVWNSDLPQFNSWAYIDNVRLNP